MIFTNVPIVLALRILSGISPPLSHLMKKALTIDVCQICIKKV